MYKTGYAGMTVYSYHSDIKEIVEAKPPSMWECWSFGKDWIVVDVGAHVGLFTLYVGNQVKHLYAVEPYPLCYEFLAWNVEINELKNITVIKKAITADNGKHSFYVDSEGSGGHSLVPSKYNLKDKVTVEGVTWETFLKDYRIKRVDLAKIHLEGTEEQFLDRLKTKPKRMILSHWHGYQTLDEKRIKEKLRALGYHIVKENQENFYCELK